VISKLVKKAYSTGSFLDKKYTRQNSVPTEEKLEFAARLENLPHKCLTCVAQQAQVLTTTAWRMTRKLCMQPYKIRQVQEIEDGVYKRIHCFLNWILQVLHDSFLDSKTFLSCFPCFEKINVDL
jgi:hypothetical protein